jgi:hypothetical protein
MNLSLGRTEQAILTNKSGGALAQGDIVIVDSSTASSITTTTTGGYTSGRIGVVLEPNGIANDAAGMIAFAGYVPKINLSGSASLGDLVKTHTVAKQGVRHAAPAASGDFAQVLGTGTSPAALLFGAPIVSLGGSLHSSGTRVDVVNTTTETTALSYSVPGGILGSHGALRVTIQARIIHTVTGTLTIRFKYGGATLLTITVPEGASVADKSSDIFFLLAATGATNTQRVSGRVDMQDAANGIRSRWNQEGTGAIDSTASQTLEISVQWGAASTDLDYDQSFALVEKVGV